jgi:hypothetical protein
MRIRDIVADAVGLAFVFALPFAVVAIIAAGW